MSEWTPIVVAVLVGACAIPNAVVAWALLVSNKRLSEHNRDLLKAVLAHSASPAAVNLAGGMEVTDRAARVEPQQRAQPPPGYGVRVPREVGS